MECWICLAGEENGSENGAGSAGGGSLSSSFCRCPSSVRPVHPRCLGRWQIQKAGTREETHCRFCNSAYQLDWRTSLSAPSLASHSSNSSLNSSLSTTASITSIQAGDQQPHQPQQPSSAALSAARSSSQQQQQPRSRRPPTPIMAIIFEGQVHRIKVYPGPEGKARFQAQIRELVQLRDDEEFEVEFECKAPDSGAVLHLDGMDAFDAATHCASLTAAERLTRQKQQRHSSSSSTISTGGEQQDQQQGDQEQQQASRAASLRQHGATADVQLQVAAQHSAGDSCPNSTAQHGTAAGRTAAVN